jgi:hypothetical protein
MFSRYGDTVTGTLTRLTKVVIPSAQFANSRELDQNCVIVFLCLALPDLSGIKCQIRLRFSQGLIDTYFNTNELMLIDHRDVCFALGQEVMLILDRECPSVIWG